MKRRVNHQFFEILYHFYTSNELYHSLLLFENSFFICTARLALSNNVRIIKFGLIVINKCWIQVFSLTPDAPSTCVSRI